MKPALNDLQSFYRAARRQEEPERADRRAVRAALLGAGATSIAAHAGAVSGKLLTIVPGGAKVFTLTQIAGYVGLGVALGAGGAVVSFSTTRTPAVPTVTPPATSARAHAAPKDALRAETAPAPPNEPAPKSSERRVVTQTQPLPASAPSLLIEESRALAEVQVALSTHDPSRALNLLAAQNREFSAGALGQERSAARVFALCEAGQTAAAQAARAQFLVNYPQSPLAKRVSAACER